MQLIVHADGASRGNPGEAAGGAVILHAETGELMVEIGVLVGHASNNVAEYRGMIEGITVAKGLNPDGEVIVRLDSKLVVEQMSGNWKVKHPDMQQLVKHAHSVIDGMAVRFEWVPRNDNALADAAANRALDEGRDFVIHY